MGIMNKIAQEVIDRQDECTRLRAALAASQQTVEQLRKDAGIYPAVIAALGKCVARNLATKCYEISDFCIEAISNPEVRDGLKLALSPDSKRPVEEL